jgi:Dolichyl-phosphate-mannose-protein mannosyltransferase
VRQNVDAQSAPPRGALTLRAAVAERWFALGIVGIALAATTFFLLRLTAWPPHEDETLALFTGRDSLLGTIAYVTRERGGAPLHFLFAWGVVHLGFGWRALRLVSAVLAVVSIPAMAVLGRRLTDARTALLGTTLAAGSWLFLFYGTFGRMYSLFLFTTVLAALALLRAVDRGRPRDWALWGVAILAAVASHPYGALVVAAHGLFVLLAHRERLRAAIVAFGVVLVTGIPFWLTDLTLAGRFDVGVGGGGRQLGGPSSVANFAWQVAGDFSNGRRWLLILILCLAAVGAVSVPWETLALALSLAAVPAIAFLGARLHTAAAPQTRHLIFVLPLFSLLVAAGIARIVRRLPALAVVAVAALLVAEVGWTWHRTPGLLKGEPSARVAARDQASAWLASTARPDDVLFGYEPIYLGAWERNRDFSTTIVPRADAVLAYRVLTRSTPLGRGVFILDASDSHNRAPSMTIALRSPQPAAAFEVRRFGPFLVVRTRDATQTPQRFLALAEATERLGRGLGLDDSVINLDIVLATERRFN